MAPAAEGEPAGLLEGPAEEVWEAELAADVVQVDEPEDCLARPLTALESDAADAMRVELRRQGREPTGWKYNFRGSGGHRVASSQSAPAAASGCCDRWFASSEFVFKHVGCG